MRALFESHNLIGDALCISAALRAWHRDHPEYEIDLLTHDDVVAELYRGMGVPLQVIFELAGRSVPPDAIYNITFNFDVSKAFDICDKQKCPLPQGYAELLGVEIGDKAEDLGPFYDPPILAEDDELVSRIPQDTILIAPFSKSCSSHTRADKRPNKTLPWAKWRPILKFLRTLNKPIRLTGAASDRADELNISEDEYLTGFPLRPLARAMKEGRIHVCISVDNGISHLSGSQKISHVLLYPMCLGLHYAIPWSNPYVVPIHMDPFVADSNQLMRMVSEAYDVTQALRIPGSPLLHRPFEELESENNS